jgi:hypothetical protein
MMIEAVRTFEKSVYFNETVRRYIPEDCHLQSFTVFSMFLRVENFTF